MEFVPYEEENPYLRKAYKENNYKIRYHGDSETGGGGTCYVYFSSNGLYVKDSLDSFCQRVITEDRYEWIYNVRDLRPEKEIFIRDIWLSWYVKGINETLNTIEKVIEWLQEECRGYQIVTVGCSSGGYMAVIAGCLLRAKRCFCICGQVSLIHHNNHVNENPLLRKYYNETWFECYKMLDTNKEIKVIYMYPAYVEHDVVQAEFLTGRENVLDFKFDRETHGIMAYDFDHPLLFSMTNQELELLYHRFYQQCITQDDFSAAVGGEERVRRKLGKEVRKFKNYFHLMNQWLSYLEKGSVAADFFAERGYYTIAVYGYGAVGKHLVAQLKGSPVHISYLIDRTAKCDSAIPVVRPDEEFPSADAIVVTPVAEYREIRNHVRKKYAGSIISINEIFDQ